MTLQTAHKYMYAARSLESWNSENEKSLFQRENVEDPDEMCFLSAEHLSLLVAVSSGITIFYSW